MRVEVVIALPHRQERVSLDLPLESTVLDAIQASGLLQPLQQFEPGCVGVWGRQVSAETSLRDGDRVEIYRPLIADPKESRRKRAAKAGK